jgi:hypothetical protein
MQAPDSRLTKFERKLMDIVNLFVYDKRAMTEFDVPLWADELREEIRNEMASRINWSHTMQTEAPMTDDEAESKPFEKK